MYYSQCYACFSGYSASGKLFVQHLTQLWPVLDFITILNKRYTTIWFFNHITTEKYSSCTDPQIISAINLAGHGCSAVPFYDIFYMLDKYIVTLSYATIRINKNLSNNVCVNLYAWNSVYIWK